MQTSNRQRKYLPNRSSVAFGAMIVRTLPNTIRTPPTSHRKWEFPSHLIRDLSGTVEGLNNKAKLIIRKSYGFRTANGIEIALFHGLGDLPEPEFTHKFC